MTEDDLIDFLTALSWSEIGCCVSEDYMREEVRSLIREYESAIVNRMHEGWTGL